MLLKTSGEGEREEIYKNLSSQLSIEEVSGWNLFDGVLINMITGARYFIRANKIYT